MKSKYISPIITISTLTIGTAGLIIGSLTENNIITYSSIGFYSAAVINLLGSRIESLKKGSEDIDKFANAFAEEFTSRIKPTGLEERVEEPKSVKKEPKYDLPNIWDEDIDKIESKVYGDRK